MGGTDVQMLMACLDIRAPSLTTINNLKKMIEQNEKSMVKIKTLLGK